jgi:GAF domain-containing protein
MDRRAKPKKGKAETKRPLARESPKEPVGNRDVEKRLAEALGQLQTRNRELAEAHEQQTATSEILRIISQSPTELQPVLDAVAANAARVCGATDALIMRVAGHDQRRVAHFGPIPLVLPGLRRITSGTTSGRAILECRAIHVHDILDPDVARDYSESAAPGAVWRTMLTVPLVREGVAIGAITIRRTEVRPFTENQIDLLETFSDQAVIAIENVRLFTETKEALEQQTATSEILKVIASSPTDVQPVFDAIARHAVALCGGVGGMVVRYDGAVMRLAAFHNVSAKAWELHQTEYPRPPDRTVPVGAAIVDRTIVHVPNLQASTRFAGSPVQRSGRASMIAVPLLRDGEAIGAIGITRDEPEGFSDRDIALLKTFADQAVIAIENVRLFNETKEALEQQTATAEVLGVIASSPTDLQPVLNTVAERAARLCGANDATIFQVEDEALRPVARWGSVPTVMAFGMRYPISRALVSARAIIDSEIIHIEDVTTRFDEFPDSKANMSQTGVRTVLAAPLFRESTPIGVILIRRLEVRPFNNKQIALLKTFANQAVIAIENVRLFKELEARNRDLTATSEILRVISSSPTDVQPVFDTIVRSAVRLCDGLFSALHQFDGELLHLVAHHNYSPEAIEEVRRLYPARPSRGQGFGRAILERAIVHIPDVEIDPEYQAQALSRAIGFRSGVFVPMLREGVPIGAIMVARAEAGPFSDSEIALLKTFADQAVIAVENVRLFTELEASNRGLIAALDKQTATSDILRVISRSQTNVQPVFDAILGSAVRLLRGYSGVVTRMAGDQIELAALTSTDDAGDAATRAAFPQSHQSHGPHAQAMHDRTSINITDAQTDPRVSEAVRANARARGNRSWIIVPLLRHDEAVGTIAVTRREPGGFTDDEIALLRTFADQAVIAIENARLLTELQARTQELSRSVGELQALGEVGQAISSTLDLETVLTTIVSRAVQLSGLDGGVVFEYDESTEEFVQRAATDPGGALAEARRTTRIRKGEGVLGRTAITLEPIQVPDITLPAAYEGRLRETLVESGIRAILAVPMVREGRLIGCLAVTRNHPGDFPADTIELLRTFATQSALAIQNARLFHEIEDKGRQLEVASQHKSEFLANMSHELRTPLNAVIGFSEVLIQRMFGELNEKQDEYLKDIYASGQHLLSLINDILDLSKIEAGRMELEVADFDLPSAIDNALILVRERATRRGITLGRTIDERLGTLRGDERKVKQVLLNLLSNALKFTPEGGRIDVTAWVHDDVADIAVADTGVGIAPEDQEAVFEEFRQVGTADKKVEGTGLGLALSRKFIELHGGKIWVKSQVGHGSTFTFTLPMRREE